MIHTVGPVWHGGASGEAHLLAGCYRSALTLAREHGLGSVAFPAISCGVFGYPPAKAAAVARRVLVEFLATDRTLERVLLVAYDDAMSAVLQAAVCSAAR